MHFLEIDRVKVKGKDVPTALFALYSDAEYARRSEELAEARQALEAYKPMDFTLALERYRNLSASFERKTLRRLRRALREGARRAAGAGLGRHLRPYL